MKFEDKLIKLRKEKGLSQEELGNGINVSRQAISKWESGQVKPEIEKIKELSQFFNVSTDYLIKDEIEESEPKLKKQKNKKKILKIVKIVLLAIIVLYLIIVIYRYSILMMCAKKIEQIEDYEEYRIGYMTITNNKLTNEVIQGFESIIYKNGISYNEYYSNLKITRVDNFEQVENVEYTSNMNNIPNIEYKNLNEKIAYGLLYDYQLGKYIYDNYEDDYYETEEEKEAIYKSMTIKQVAENYVPNYINLGTALDLRIKINIDEVSIYIQENFKDGYQKITIDRQTGILQNVMSVGDTAILYESYSYDLEKVDDSEIQEPDVEYVMAEEIYGE